MGKPLVDKKPVKKPLPLLQLAIIVVIAWLGGGSLVYEWISKKHGLRASTML